MIKILLFLLLFIVFEDLRANEVEEFYFDKLPFSSCAFGFIHKGRQMQTMGFFLSLLLSVLIILRI